MGRVIPLDDLLKTSREAGSIPLPHAAAPAAVMAARGPAALADATHLSPKETSEKTRATTLQMLSSIWDERMACQASQVLQATANKDPNLAKMRAQLGASYTSVKQQGIPLTGNTEALIHQALGDKNYQGGGGGGLNAINNLANGNFGGGGLGNLGGGGLGWFGNFGGGLGGLFGGRFGGGGGGGSVNGFNGQPLSDADKAFLDQSISQSPDHFKNLFSGFRQTSQPNCATVAPIKAAMDRYDNQVFDSVTPTADGYHLQMQDGYQTDLSNREINWASQNSGFVGKDPEVLAYANLCYAAMAKRAGGGNIGSGMAQLNQGNDPRYTAGLLGLRDKEVPVNPQTLNDQDSCVAWSGAHAIFVDRMANGEHVADHYGTPYYWNGTDTLGYGTSGAYTFKPRTYPSQQYAVGPSTNGGGETAAATPSPPTPTAPTPTTTMTATQ